MYKYREVYIFMADQGVPSPLQKKLYFELKYEASCFTGVALALVKGTN